MLRKNVRERSREKWNVVGNNDGHADERHVSRFTQTLTPRYKIIYPVSG